MSAWEDIMTTDFVVTESSRQSYADPAGPLRWALRIDGLSTGLVGVGLIAGAAGLDSFVGVPASALVGLGLFFIGWFAVLWRLAAARRPSAPAVLTVIGINVAWLVASAAIVATDALSLTGAGVVVVVLMAAAVAMFVDGQVLGLRRLSRAHR